MKPPTAANPVPTTSDQSAERSITVRNCNSIDEACITLCRGGLNVKYGPNGIGKSTIARALTLNAEGENALAALTPFKGGLIPSVEGAESITSVLTFDDGYVSQFAFTRDEVLKDSFEIFINTEEYQSGLIEIEELLASAKNALIDDEQFEVAIEDFRALHSAFTVTRAGDLGRNSKGFKALAVGGSLVKVPDALAGYDDFIRGEAPANWVSWQAKGYGFLDGSDNCPFCAVPEVNKDTVREVAKVYDSASVKNMTALRSAIENLGKYLAPASLELLKEVTGSLSDLTIEQRQFIVKLHGDVETFLGKLDAVRGLSFATLRDVDNVNSRLDDLIIDLKYLTHLESAATFAVAGVVNNKIEEVKAAISEIRAKLGMQKSRVGRLIRDNEKSINDFLSSAGYRYEVRVEPSGDSYRMILEHRDAAGHIAEAVKHLSYGERNAFALILFMHQVKHDKPDLAVLDDPVSSFDKTKKFAIFHKLFTGKDSIRDVTTLFLTHDIEPVIDMIRTGTSRYFTAAQPAAAFLRSRSGMITEQEIAREDVQTFSSVCKQNVRTSDLPLVRCIYLRRYLEVVGDLGAAYDILASLLHGRAAPTSRDDDSDMPMTDTDRDTGVAQIRTHINDFDYDTFLGDRLSVSRLYAMFNNTEIGYERLQITRMLIELDGDAGSSTVVPEALMKFINESYHVENEYLVQLNPREFDAVPEYVLTACEDLANEIVARATA
ncbi:MAG: AAA family ATPase [Corynebacterium sp.]|uniref:AAA family ATPase n=1 Tax=Corynebacterium sp. TaxID=1720 RepID=UPI003F077B6D